MFIIEVLEGQAQTDLLINFGTRDVSATGIYPISSIESHSLITAYLLQLLRTMPVLMRCLHLLLE